MDLTSKQELLSYLKLKGLWAKKGLSQNFLVDRNALDKIVGAAELTSDDLVIEIGPGLGVLSDELVDRSGAVVSIELDDKLAELLSERKNAQISKSEFLISKQIQNSKFQILNSDILKVNFNELIGDRKYKVVANIPYHITSKILELFLSRENKPKAMVLLVQKEVAERICAEPGEMSVLAVSVQLYGRPEIIDIVPKESFFPSPKVDSAILRIVIARNEVTKQSKDRRAALAMTKEEEKEFFRCVHIGFASRRKTLVNNLSSGYRIDKKEAFDIIKAIGLGESVRAQELSVDEWKLLSSAINRI